EAREKDLLILENPIDDKPVELKNLDDFYSLSVLEIKEFFDLSLPLADIELIVNYFKSEKRVPTETEMKVLDTYWSDHCRHTTFATNLKVNILDENINQAYDKYLVLRKKLNHNKPITLMDMATINMRYEKANNNLRDLEISNENNACSIYIDVEGQDEKYLLMFKNETHNHPTEIEPYGGASTCLGGAIRDPLSGRAYVYQAMRITGSGDIRASISDTLPGKLPQRIISKRAAEGYSSYGNQIGLPTGHVREIYHEGYMAKRMEVGAVIAAAPVSNVVRAEPKPGDVVILLGGKTGRDGIGGATGSSKGHTNTSLLHSAAEVQKGNATEERKIQRLFRNPEATNLIKKANDFGAGGVSVAIGELCEGLEINLNAVPTKYQGLNATEIAISESQERMAVVVESTAAKKFINLANEENLEANIVAIVTDNKRLVMKYNNKTVVDIHRDFINTNGVIQKADALVEKIDYSKYPKRKYLKDKTSILEHLRDLNISSQKGLTQMFDATIGASTVLMPYGGLFQDTPTQGAVCKIPVLRKETKTCSIMTYGFNPYISSFSPYHGSKQSIIEAMAKTVAIGGDYEKIRFTFQEYFERLGKDTKKWGKPVSSLLGTIETLHDFSLASVGGKDSMSGSFEDLNVPPTLIAFAVSTQNSDYIISPELKKPGNFLYLAKANCDDKYLVDVQSLKVLFSEVSKLIKNKVIVSAFALEAGGLSEALIKMALGNRLGCKVKLDNNQDLFNPEYGSILVESKDIINCQNFIYLGKVTKGDLQIDEIRITHEEAKGSLDELANIYPVHREMVDSNFISNSSNDESNKRQENKETVKVLIPVFPGTNCDYDIARAFELAGAKTNLIIFKNQNETDIIQSFASLSNAIKESDIFVLCGGFSTSDEPNSNAKFVATVLDNQKIKAAINSFLAKKGLILGIGSGFQALVKSGLLPNGNFNFNEDSPTFISNNLNCHVSRFVKTRVSSKKSPWLSSFNLGEIHNLPISHSEAKLYVNEKTAQELFANNQVAFQYCDEFGNPSNNPEDNPTGSLYAIEGLISKDGLILGKMGHSERFGENVFKNIYGNKSQNIFINAIKYFKGVS
ncbi:MAG: phosphoribosylformylglycinamidine synthase, partial [Bacilli bacterium]|nr:phosphoribosylformylglycinamidine synthase [Bacilli bacterium]